MGDHHGNLAEIEEGRSLLPVIVKKEQELKARLREAEAAAEKLAREAAEGAEKAIAEAKAGFPEAEAKFLEAEIAKYAGALEELEKTERDRLEALRAAAEAKVDAAAAAVVGLVTGRDG